MTTTHAYLITWTTYGTFLPGDPRGWRKRQSGPQLPRPGLEKWCRDRMTHDAVLLSADDRDAVHKGCQEHCDFRGWTMLAVNARSNHVHVVVISDRAPKTTRDQLKANCTRSLRQQEVPLNVPKTWSKGGHVDVLDTDDEIESAIIYVTEAQDRKSVEY
ncbi:MAG: transposase [Pirellulaceae bacterium]